MIQIPEKMMMYEYQVLRYVHDITLEEFVNIGFVLFAPDIKYLNSRGTHKYGRIAGFFHVVPGNYIVRSIKHFENSISEFSERLTSELSFTSYKSIEDFTSKVLPKDDSSFQLSQVKKGLTLDVSKTFDELFQKYVGKNEKSTPRKSRSDDDAWRLVYKKYFDKHEISQKLTEHTINTKHDKFTFEHSIKNGKYHCYQPISFDLLEEKDIKEKVYKWVGKISELETATESFKLNLLTLLPQSPYMEKTTNWVNEQLLSQKQNLDIEIVKEKNADNFFREEKQILED